ncbi:MAG: hypothetical protein IEMM0003_0916 [bacterium]|nr:MAG: hypothetical protein IEMM0003_0916 [bacterium]
MIAEQCADLKRTKSDRTAFNVTTNFIISGLVRNKLRRELYESAKGAKISKFD